MRDPGVDALLAGSRHPMVPAVQQLRAALFDPLTAEQTAVLRDALEAVVEALDPDATRRVAHGGDVETP